jgi:hypothetical protein
MTSGVTEEVLSAEFWALSAEVILKGLRAEDCRLLGSAKDFSDVLRAGCRSQMRSEG